MKTSTRAMLFASLLGSTIATGAAAQDAAPSQPAPSQSAPTISPGAYENDIMVSGRLGNPLPNHALDGLGAKASRIANSDARMFVRCIRHAPPELLRPIVEGHSRNPATNDALDRVIRTNAGCYHGFATSPISSASSPYYGQCNPIALRNDSLCRAVYDRGALIEDAFKTYAPKFMLMPADTLSKPVIERFRAREAVRGNYRSPMDRRFYDAVTCMVQLEPQRAVRLLRAEPGLEREARLRYEIISKTRRCTGNARQVKVDPFQFRAYLADAVYHWTIAAKGVDTLVPDS